MSEDAEQINESPSHGFYHVLDLSVCIKYVFYAKSFIPQYAVIHTGVMVVHTGVKLSTTE